MGSFEAAARYETGGQAAGARWTHIPSGISVDLIYAGPLAQGFVWTHTLPVSERGEPLATAELLLPIPPGDSLATCGNPGWVCSSLVTQSHTLFPFARSAPADSTPVPAALLSRLMLPDFSPADFRREIWDLTVQESNDTLRLQEGGQLLLDLERRAIEPRTIVMDKAIELAYGRDHPLSMPADGKPGDLRDLTPDDIRAYIRDFYYPDRRMGIVLFAPAADEEAVLSDLDTLLRDIRAARDAADSTTAAAALRRAPAEIPDFSSRGASALYMFPFPSDTPDARGFVLLEWPPASNMPPEDLLLLDALWQVMTGGSAPALARDLMADAANPARTIAAIEGEIPALPGHPPFIWLAGAAPEILRPDSLVALRQRVSARIAWIAALAPDSPELVPLRDAARAHLRTLRDERARSLAEPNLLDAVEADMWYWRLQETAGQPGFVKDLLARAQFERADSMLVAGNPWTALAARARLDREPYVVAARPDTSEAAKIAAAERKRLAATLDLLCKNLGVSDRQEALRIFRERLAAQGAEGRR